MPLSRSMMQSHGTKKVTIIHLEGTEDEIRHEVEAMIQAESGFFDVETPVYEGDVVEFPDPRGGTDRKLAAEVHVNDFGSATLRHTQVKWGKAPALRAAPVRRLRLEGLHPTVVDVSSNLFADGHYASAVSEAFKSIEIRVRGAIGSKQSGTKLMGEAFGGAKPKLNVATSTGQSAADEQEGFQALFRGAMLGVRNPLAHDLLAPQEPQQALEYLALASLLHRRLDLATA